VHYVVRRWLVELLQSYQNEFKYGKLYVVYAMQQKLKLMLEKGEFDKEHVSALLEFYDDKNNLESIFSACEKIKDDYDIKSVSIGNIMSGISPALVRLLQQGKDYSVYIEQIQSWLTDDFGMEMTLRNFSFLLVQILAMAIYEQKGIVDKEEYAMLAATVERGIFHSSIEGKEQIIANLNKCGMEDVAGKLTLLIV
jgi:hypothetical protein